MAERILQRMVMPTDRALSSLYCRFSYGRSRPFKRGRRAIVLPQGTAVRSDTWFNAFFESYWRQYTSLSALDLRLRLSGSGRLRLYRCSSDGEKSLLQEIAVRGHKQELCVETPIVRAELSRSGMLFFELESHSPRLMLHRAEWVARNVMPRSTRLAVCFCTYNRASQLIRNVATLLTDPGVAETLDRIIVVDQGKERVRDHPDFSALERAAAGRLLLLEQENHGGTGGFTRGILEAQSAGSATHVLLMDDDIILEPESIFRTAAFMSLARGDVAVGGHLLDRSHPHLLVETGSRYLPESIRIDEPKRCRILRPNDLLPFLEPRPRHYNGWWFCAFPLAVLDRVGLPLPLFLRGDDMEFGCRLMRRGVQTVSLPGIAVWHEALERKGRSWQPFYELRNLLIVGALHFPIVRAATVARQFLSRLLDELLTYDYYESWLMCRAASEYLRGPGSLRLPPHVVQQQLQAMGEKLVERRDNGGLLSRHRPPVIRRSLRRWRWTLLLRNLLLPSPSTETPPRTVLHGAGAQWYHIGNADVVAVEEADNSRIVVLRRSRARFLRLLLRGTWLAFRLLLGHRRAVSRWRASVSTLTSRTFWDKILQRCSSFSHQPRRERSSAGDNIAA